MIYKDNMQMMIVPPEESEQSCPNRCHCSLFLFHPSSMQPDDKDDNDDDNNDDNDDDNDDDDDDDNDNENDNVNIGNGEDEAL